jgi:Flp pilus assembly protein TadG
MRQNIRPRTRPGAAAMEFAIVASLLFLIFLGMVEVGRAMMVAGALSNAARVGARAGAITDGDYSNITAAVTTALNQANLPSANCTVTVTVNGTTVTDDTTFQTAASPGTDVSVQVSVPAGNVSWFPAGTTFFLGSSQTFSGTVVMRRES